MNKITIYVSELNLRGGTHKQVLQFVDIANKLGVDTDIITPVYDPNKTFEGFRKYKISAIYSKFILPRFKCLLRIQHMFAQILCGFGVDRERTCFIHDNKCYFFIVTLLLRGIPYYWQINDPDSSFNSGINMGRKIKFVDIRRHIATKFLYRATEVFVNVTKNKDIIFHNTGVEPHVFYCGVEQTDQRFQPEGTLLLKHACNLNVLTIGVVQPHRNYLRLINALDLVSEAKSFTLNIVGSTKSDLSYSQTVREATNKSTHQVILLGNISEQELALVFQNTDLFVFVNEDQSCGLSIFEAIANRKPVLISQTVGALELLDDFPTVFAVNEKSEVDIAAGLDRLILEMSKKASSDIEEAAIRVRNMTWEKMYVQPVLKILGVLDD